MTQVRASVGSTRNCDSGKNMTPSSQHAAAAQWLKSALALDEGAAPFPWQLRLLRQLLDGQAVDAIDIPTGLGKTSVMAIWLVARALGASVPRRLAYVVDRRAVVDQATEVAQCLRDTVAEHAELAERLGLSDRKLPISTLRGQFVDNREWMDDPAAPAIIVGTVDMVGSRLLFEGYGVSSKMRPYQAGLLGQDTWVVFDEAHLAPPFERLLRSIDRGRERFGPARPEHATLLPAFRLTALSATGNAGAQSTLTLDDDDRSNTEVRRRLEASKRLSFRPLEAGTKLADALANDAWELSDQGRNPIRCLIFSDKRDVAVSARDALDKRAKQQASTDLFVGGRRIFERAAAAKKLETEGFLAGSSSGRDHPAFVFATSAAEVGVDLDADHCVCDLVTWERMVQRFGRVNRRGRGAARVIVVVDPKAVAEIEGRLGRQDVLAAPFEELQSKDGSYDVSPAALVALKSRATTDEGLARKLEKATTPAPVHPELTRPLLDAWAMTSLDDHPGRPEVEPWLRGWIPDEEPQVQLAWRKFLPSFGLPGALDSGAIDQFWEAAPPHFSELLETPTHRAMDWLEARSRAVRAAVDAGVIAELLDSAGKCVRTFTASDFDFERPYENAYASKKRRDAIAGLLAGRMLIVNARLGGLAAGLLSDSEEASPPTADDSANDRGHAPIDRPFPVDFRVRLVDSEKPELGTPWHERFRRPIALDEEEQPSRWCVVEKWHALVASEEGRSSGPAQLLEEHQDWTAQAARDIARRLQLPAEYEAMLSHAGRLHDEGKRAARWQRAFHAPSGQAPYAKTPGPIDLRVLDGYRHELGSLPYVEKDARTGELPEELRELVLHLIAAHHGFARPLITTRACDDAPPSLLRARAQQIAMRFARLQRRWGPWGLAWWEALMRAADQQASRRNERERGGSSDE
jgi:CRISPR-associated endonuclease/helicase Cas3